MMYYAVLLVFIFEYMRPENYIPVLRNTFFFPLMLLFISLYGSKKGKPANTDVLHLPNTKSLLFYLSLIIISAVFADVTFYVWTYFQAAIGYFILYFLVAKEINDLDKLKGLFGVLIMAHIAMAILNPDMLLHPETRHYLSGVGTFLGDGNDFAWSVCIVVPFVIFLYLNTSSWKKIMSIFTLVVLILCVVGTQSRGAILSLSSILLYQVMKSRKKMQGIIAIVSVVVIVMLFAPSAFFERMNSIKDYETEGSAQGRILAWKSAVRMAVAHPLTGVGADHFAVAFGTDFRPDGYGRTEFPWLNAHSIYFKILGEFGFPGIFFLMYIIVSNFFRNERTIALIGNLDNKQSRQYRSLHICVNSSLIGFAVGGIFLSGIKYPHLFVVAGILSATQLITNKQVSVQVAQ